MERIDILKEPEIHLKGEQKKVYCLPSNGPVLVKGSAGSGKTLVAIARARYLKNLAQQDMFSRNVRIAFFTYDKSLRDEVATYFNDRQIYVNNIDSWVAGFLSRRNGHRLQEPLTNYQIRRECIRMAKSLTFSNSPNKAIAIKGNDFYFDEIEWIKSRLIETESEYVEMPRSGRGTADRVTKEDRHLLWHLKEVFDAELEKRNLTLFADRISVAIKELERHPLDETDSFSHVIVDEAQDFTLAQLRLISLIANGDASTSKSISLFADVAQTIYESGFSWKDANITVAGSRSFTFNHNYRNTKQIAQAASSLLSHEENKDEIVDMTIPERDGAKPILLTGNAKNVVGSLKVIIDSIPIGETCAIGVCTNKEKDTLVNALGTRFFATDKGKTTQSDQNGRKVIHVRTLQKMKGLQFDNVILWDMTEGRFPSPWDADKDLSKLRKLLYVAMTRACKMLVICAFGKPSPLVSEIAPTLLEVRNV